VYIIAGAQNVQAMFRNSRDLDGEWFALAFTERIFGLPKEDERRLGEDASGIYRVPQGEVCDGGRIWKRIRDVYHTTMEGSGQVAFLAEKWVNEFVGGVEDSTSQSEWMTISIYKFVRQHILRATIITFAGPRLFEASSTFDEDFWEFDKTFLSLLYLRSAPRFLCQRGWDVRDRLVEATNRYLASAWEEYGKSADKDDVEWEPHFGHRVLRAREKEFEAYGVSQKGRATLEIAFLWA
jgi:hypothetical protein